MRANADIRVQADLFATLIKANGERIELGDLKKRKSWLRRLMDWSLFDQRGLVTVAGVNYMASDFASGGVTPTISGFKFHASGTGTNAAANSDTALQTDSGVARVSGTASNPSANIYKSVATMAYTTTLAITEWGVFSASTVGTLWDRRVFSAINVVNGDSISFSYSLTIPSN
jgi:hypothetical protein